MTPRNASTVSRTPCSSGVSGESNHGFGSSSGNGSATSSNVISAPGTTASIAATTSAIATAAPPRLNVCAPAGSAARRLDERPRDVGRVVQLRTAAEGDPVRLAARGRVHRECRARGEALVPAGPVDRERAQADARDAVVVA